jgi:hypothetical protein
MNVSDARARVTSLLKQAEAIIESLEAKEPGGRWAMTAFSRYKSCQLLGVSPYEPYDGDLDGDPAELLDQAAREVDRLEVSVDGLSWRLAVADALRSAAVDIRMVQDARDV